MPTSRKPRLSLLQSIDPYEFEQVVADVWESLGYSTEVTDGSRDRGIDIMAMKQEPVLEKQLIQAKRYSQDNRVGSEEIRKYATLYQQEPDVDSVVIVTSSTFTDEAITLAGDLNVTPINGVKLRNMIAEHAPDAVEKYQSVSNEPPSESHLTESVATTRSDTDVNPVRKNRAECVEGGTDSTDISDSSGSTSASPEAESSMSDMGDATIDATSAKRLSSGLMLLLRLAFFVFGAITAFGSIVFSIRSLISLSLHPLLLPWVGIFLGTIVLFGVLEQAYDRSGFRLVIVRSGFALFLIMSVVGTLEFLGIIQPGDQSYTIGIVAWYYILTGLLYALDSRLRTG